MRYLLAADTGDTFTDIVVFDQRTKATQFGKGLSA
jgi:N-methylhydantoinase A/oxoprolinase/acetone carboxylase beta subunit